MRARWLTQIVAASLVLGASVVALAPHEANA
jgi:hypothetical protein